MDTEQDKFMRLAYSRTLAAARKAFRSWHSRKKEDAIQETLTKMETVASFLEFFRPRTGLMQGLRGLCAIGRLLIPLHVQGDTLANVFSRPH